MYKRILIVGDAGRGKSTFAGKLSEKTGIPSYSTDDFFWKVKYTEPNEKAWSVEEIGKVYEGDRWIVEGSTSRLVEGGFDRADVIYLLRFGGLLPQYWALAVRHMGRKETLLVLWNLLRHVTWKKRSGRRRALDAALAPHDAKVVRLNSWREIRECLDGVERKKEVPSA